MSLATQRPTLKAALLALANTTNDEKTKDEAIDEFLDALENWLVNATVTVPGTGLTSPSGPVTGISQGTLS